MREAAAALAPALGLEPYDALMDGYQRGMRTADVAPVFAEYETFLRRCAAAGRGAPGAPSAAAAARRARSRSRCRRRCAAASPSASGLDFAHARLDRSAHPFSGGTPTDVRITTRYDEADFTQAVLAVVHETGHALYERGLPAAWARQPVGEAAGMAAHESQSLIVEMQACRSDAFLSWLGPELHADVRRRSRALSAGQPGAAVAARRARLHPRRRRRDDLSRACHPALPPGAGAGRRDPGGRRPARRVERRVPRAARHRAARRRARLPAGHPLVRRRVRLFPQLHAGRDGGGATDGGGAARGRRTSTRRSAAATWRRCWTGCAPRCTARAACSSSTTLLSQATGKPLDPADFQAHLTARYLH